MNKLAGLSGWPALWASLLPVAKLESIDEFDYATYGGQPILFPEANREGALQTLTLTWDLQRLFRSADSRVKAIDAARARAALIATRDQLTRALTILEPTQALRHGEFSIVRLGAVPDDRALRWQKDPAVDSWPATMLLTADGALVGVARCPGPPPCTLRLGLKVTDGLERSSTRSVELPIHP